MSGLQRVSQIQRYFEAIGQLMQEVLQTQEEAMHKAAELFASTVEKKHSLYITGCSHASIFAQEVFYRAGGFILMNPLFIPGMTLGTPPVSLTTRYERISGIGEAVLAESPVRAHDVLVIASVSGRNVVSVEMAMAAKERGIQVVALTSVRYSSQVTSRHPSGKRLFEVADLVLDMMCPPGDALLEIEGLQEKTAPASTIVGSTMLHAVISQTLQLLLEKGIAPPVFLSANLDGADEFNRQLLTRYKENITYM